MKFKTALVIGGLSIYSLFYYHEQINKGVENITKFINSEMPTYKERNPEPPATEPVQTYQEPVQTYQEPEPMNCQDPEIITGSDAGVYDVTFIQLHINKNQSPFEIELPGYSHSTRIQTNIPIHYRLDVVRNNCITSYGTMQSRNLYNENGEVTQETGPYCGRNLNWPSNLGAKEFCRTNLAIKVSPSTKGDTPRECGLVTIIVKSKTLEVASPPNYACW
ncbi:MAG: hypothetical protein KJ623_04515 [Nanoarchaeota archaeon]|nr:hypothetical protein [Nanoarchaeota archaeon]MBU0962440.1 hypothetical protein [Nanoarchaeota archaeon]